MNQEEDLTNDPSPRRIQLARESGSLPTAPALVQAAGMIAFVALSYARGPVLAESIMRMIDETWAELPELARTGYTSISLHAKLLNFFAILAEPLLTICLGTVATIVIVHQIASGGSWTPTLAIPQPSRLMAFWKKFDEDDVSHKPPMTHRIFLGMLRPIAAAAGCLFVLLILRSRWTNYSIGNEGWSDMVLKSNLIEGRTSIGLGLAILTLPLLILGFIELFLSRLQWWNRLRPTAEQARRESREIEGDPELKRKRISLVRKFRDASTIHDLIAHTSVLIVGSGISGLCVQLVRSKNGRLAVGHVVRGTLSARYAEKAASKGLPWLRDSKLALRLATMVDRHIEGPIELPPVISSQIEAQLRQNGMTVS